MSLFQFKHFSIKQENAAMKVGTDAMLLGCFLPFPIRGNALDIGCGTGVLSLMYVQRNPEAIVLAIEIDQVTQEECQENFEQSQFSSQLNSLVGDFLDFSFKDKFECIFSNPPFYENSFECQYEKRNVARANDYLPFDLLFQKVSNLLVANGRFQLIVPAHCEKDLIAKGIKHGLFLSRIITIQSKKGIDSRIILTFTLKEVNCQRENFILRNEDNSYTDEYIELSKDFHDRDLRK